MNHQIPVILWLLTSFGLVIFFSKFELEFPCMEMETTLLAPTVVSMVKTYLLKGARATDLFPVMDVKKIGSETKSLK
jgi:hypothetical protein